MVVKINQIYIYTKNNEELKNENLNYVSKLFIPAEFQKNEKKKLNCLSL